MAKKSIIARQRRREVLVDKYFERRAELKTKISSAESSYDEKIAAGIALQKLPRNGSRTRYQSRCKVTGRGRGVNRIARIGGMKLRPAVMQGELPGARKASW